MFAKRLSVCPYLWLGQESTLYMNVCNKLECLSLEGNFQSGITGIMLSVAISDIHYAERHFVQVSSCWELWHHFLHCDKNISFLVNALSDFNLLAISNLLYERLLPGSTVVEHSTHNPKVEGSKSATGKWKKNLPNDVKFIWWNLTALKHCWDQQNPEHCLARGYCFLLIWMNGRQARVLSLLTAYFFLFNFTTVCA
jgi:hypothetical protein